MKYSLGLSTGPFNARGLIISVVLFILLLLNVPAFGTDVPDYDGMITDREGIFTADQVDSIDGMLISYEKSTTVEIAILTIDTCDVPLATYAQSVATEWGVGKKGVNNGLLIVISKKMNTVRFQTGYGLEGYLPDGWLWQVKDTTMSMMQGDPYGAVVYAIQTCQAKIGNEYSKDKNDDLIKSSKGLPTWVWAIIPIILIIIFVISPEAGLWILFALIGSDSDSSSDSSFGGGDFGGGGA